MAMTTQERLIAASLEVGTAVRDAKVLEFGYLPDDLVDRVEAQAFLAATFAPTLRHEMGTSALLYGPVGSGKTAVSRRFGEDMQKVAQTRNINFMAVYVNCRTLTSMGMLLSEVRSRVGMGPAQRGFHAWELANDLKRFVQRKGVRMLIVADEVEQLLDPSAGKGHNVDFGYFLSRMNEGVDLKLGSISVLVVNESDIRGRLDTASLSTFTRGNACQLQPYSADEAREVLRRRAVEAYAPGWDEEILEVAAQQVVENHDVRVGIEILAQAGRLAVQGESPVVKLRHAKVAVERHWGGSTEAIMSLKPREREVLEALVAMESDVPVTTGQAEAAYVKRFPDQAVAHTQFWKLIKALKRLHLVQAKLSGRGQAGTTTLIKVPSSVRRAIRDMPVQQTLLG